MKEKPSWKAEGDISLLEGHLRTAGTAWAANKVPAIPVALAGDRTSFHQLYMQHKPAVRRWIQRHMRQEGEVEDLVHETFLQAWRHLPRFRGESTIGTWLFQIALNEMRQYWRQQRTWSRYQENLADSARKERLIDRTDSSLLLLMKTDTDSQLRAIIQTLPES